MQATREWPVPGPGGGECPTRRQDYAGGMEGEHPVNDHVPRADERQRWEDDPHLRVPTEAERRAAYPRFLASKGALAHTNVDEVLEADRYGGPYGYEPPPDNDGTEGAAETGTEPA